MFNRVYGLVWLALASHLTSCALLDHAMAWHPPLILASDTSGQPTTYIVAKNFYGGSYKDRSDNRAQGGGTFAAKARAPVASGAGQAQDFTRAGQQGGAVATAPRASAGAITLPGLPTWIFLVTGLAGLLVLAYRYRSYWLRPRLP